MKRINGWCLPASQTFNGDQQQQERKWKLVFRFHSPPSVLLDFLRLRIGKPWILLGKLNRTCKRYFNFDIFFFINSFISDQKAEKKVTDEPTSWALAIKCRIWRQIVKSFDVTASHNSHILLLSGSLIFVGFKRISRIRDVWWKRGRENLRVYVSL